MFVGPIQLHEPFRGVFETLAPITFIPDAQGAPVTVTVPTGFRSRLERVPPPLRRKLTPEAPAAGPAMVYACLAAAETPRSIAMAVLQEALRKQGVGWFDRLLFRLAQ